MMSRRFWAMSLLLLPPVGGDDDGTVDASPASGEIVPSGDDNGADDRFAFLAVSIMSTGGLLCFRCCCFASGVELPHSSTPAFVGGDASAGVGLPTADWNTPNISIAS